MAGSRHEIVIAIRSIFEDKGFKKATGKLALLESVAKKINRPIYQIGRNLRRVGLKITEIGKGGARFQDIYTGAFVSANNAATRFRAQLKKFPAHLLSIMFIAMQLKRVFLGFLDSAMATYMRLTEGQTLAGKAMMRMHAAWEFFKFSIIEALTPLITYFSALIVNVLDFVAANPELMKMLGIFTLLLGLVGLIASPMANVALAISGISSAAAIANTSVLGLAIPFLKILAIIAIIIAIAAILYVAWRDNWFGIRDAITNVWEKHIKPRLQALGRIMNVLGDVVKTVWNIIATAIKIAWNIIRIPIDFLIGIIEGLMGTTIDLEELWTKVFETVANVVEWAWDKIKPVLTWIGDKLNWVLDLIRGFRETARGVGQFIGETLGGFGGGMSPKPMQRGGFVDRVTPAILHPGETVLPAGSRATNITLSPIYNISGVGNSEELRRLFAEHDRNLMLELQRMKLPGV